MTGVQTCALPISAVFAEQVRLLYHLSRPAYSGTLAAALTTVIALAVAGVPVVRLGGWMSLVIAATAARFFFYKKFFASDTQPDYRVWARRFVAGAVAMGLMWGLLGSFVMAGAEWYYQLLTIFVIVGFWFLVAQGVLFYLIFRFRRRDGVPARDATGELKSAKK